MIVITGASSGLGHELAGSFKTTGRRVVNISRKKCPHADENLLYDLTDAEQIKKATAEVLQIQEPLEALVNCAGVYSEQSIEAITEKELERVYKVNVFAPILLTSQLMERIKQDHTDIVNVASTVGTKAYVDQAAYGSSKWALRGFSQNLQLELKDYPCRVISFCPGGFRSNLVKNFNSKEIVDPENWMNPKDVALCLKQLLDLPKNMEVSEILINRKQIKK